MAKTPKTDADQPEVVDATVETPEKVKVGPITAKVKEVKSAISLSEKKVYYGKLTEAEAAECEAAGLKAHKFSAGSYIVHA